MQRSINMCQGKFLHSNCTWLADRTYMYGENKTPQVSNCVLSDDEDEMMESILFLSSLLSLMFL